MKKIFKKLLSTLLATVLLFGLVPVAELNITANAEETSGVCGDNLTWTFDESTGELTISGEGDMYDYDVMGDVVLNYSPWKLFEENEIPKIKSLIINDGVTSIGDNAFYNSEKNMFFESVEIPDSVLRIGEGAFAFCEYLNNISMGSNVYSIGRDAFFETGYYQTESNWNENVLYIDHCLIQAKESISGTYTILDETKLISSSAFRGCVDLVGIDSPSSLKYIGDYAFAYCETLEKIQLSNSIVSIGSYAFDCTGYYYEISNWEDRVLYIGNYLVDVNFDYESPGDCIIKDGTKIIAAGSISGSYVTSIYIPESVERICGGTLGGWSVKEIKVNENNSYYSSDAYGVLYNKDKSKLIEYPSGNERMNFEISNSVIELGDSAFSSSEFLTKIVIPNSVVKIGNETFSFCTGLTGIEIPNTVTYIGDNAFSLCGNLVNITIPDSVTHIGRYAFYDCDKILNISVSDNVTSIKKATFAFCDKLSSLTFENDVKYIEEYAFIWCDNLTDIYYNGTEKEWNEIIVEKKGNDSLLNATIHFLGEEVHEHSYSSSITKEATCKETGVMTFTCSCNDSYTQVIPVTDHSLSHDTIPSTCKVPGIEYDYCIHCGETFNSASLPLKSHSWSAWQVRVDPTGHSDGEEYRVCSACGTEETKSIPKLNIIKDNKTGIEIEYDNQYDSGVSVQVTEIFDGTSFRLIESVYGNSNAAIFDITTVKDGVKVQPDGTVKVRIPVPADFTSNTIFVCYVDSVNGTVENIPAVVKDGYVEFEAEHFSHYAVVEKLGKVNSVDIGNISMDYKSSITITPVITADEGVSYTVTYSSSNPDVVTVDENGNLTATGKGTAEITVTVTDENGNVVTDTCEVKVKYNWWQWIIIIVLFGWIWY